MISANFSRLGFWIRLPKLGPGISVMWGGWVPFSERYGYASVLRIGRVRIKLLPRVTACGEVRRIRP